jgi:hypothetical protein
MGRSYAGILGPLAFATTVIRGLAAGHGAEGTLQTACLAMFAFAALGYVLGRAAALIVDDSVRAGFRAELEALEAEEQVARPATR